MTILLTIALFLSLVWGFHQRNRAKSAEEILKKQHKIIEIQKQMIDTDEKYIKKNNESLTKIFNQQLKINE